MLFLIFKLTHVGKILYNVIRGRLSGLYQRLAFQESLPISNLVYISNVVIFSVILKLNLGSVLNSESRICSKSFPERSNSTRFGNFSKEGTFDSELYPRLSTFTSSGISNASMELKYLIFSPKDEFHNHESVDGLRLFIP